MSETITNTISETNSTGFPTVVELTEKFNPNVMAAILTQKDKFSRTVLYALSQYQKKRFDGAQVKVPYRFGVGCEQDRIGRLYAKPDQGLQSMPWDIRDPLTADIYFDIDMENCHYNIINKLAENYEVSSKGIHYYINNREECLSRVSNDRSVAKVAYLKTAYGGSIAYFNFETLDENLPNYLKSVDGITPEGDLTNVKQVEKEIKTLITVLKSKPEFEYILNKVKEKEKANKKRTTNKKPFNFDFVFLALLCQTEERKCLEALFQSMRKNGRTVGILIHDGCRIERKENEVHFPIQLLRQAEKDIQSQTQYPMRLVEKPITHNFVIPTEPEVIINDKYAAEVFVRLMGDNIMRIGDEVFIYNDDIGMWNEGDIAIRTAITKLGAKLIFRRMTLQGEKVYDYSGNEKNVCAMRKWIATLIEESLPIDVTKSKGCILFKNGWFDMNDMTFHEGFENCKNKFFTKRVKREFIATRNYELEQHIKKVLFSNPYNNPLIGEYYMNQIARSIAGTMDKVCVSIVGKRDCGKGVMTAILCNVFDEYVGLFNMNVLKFNPREGTDEAKKLAWYADLVGCRIIIANEARMDGRHLDGNLIKTFSSGGDGIKLRKNFQDEFKTIIISIMFLFCNDLPPVSPCDEALKSRMRSIPHTKSFVSKSQSECNEYEMEGDPNLKDKIKTDDWINSFFWIIMDAYGEQMEAPKEVIEEADELFIVEDDKIEELLNEKYEFVSTENEDAFVPARELITYLTERGIRMSDTKIGRELKRLGLKKDTKKINKKATVGYYGLKE